MVAIVLMCRPTPGPGPARSALHGVVSSCSPRQGLAPPVSGTALQKAGQKTPTRNSPVTKHGNHTTVLQIVWYIASTADTPTPGRWISLQLSLTGRRLSRASSCSRHTGIDLNSARSRSELEKGRRKNVVVRIRLVDTSTVVGIQEGPLKTCR